MHGRAAVIIVVAVAAGCHQPTAMVAPDPSSMCRTLGFERQDWMSRSGFNYADSWMMSWAADGRTFTNFSDGNVAADAPYSIEDVPWTMYFDGSYALHGASWHANFGHPMSHGCVNLSPADARALFAWTEPRLPDGWHGVFAPTPAEGTRVVIHE